MGPTEIGGEFHLWNGNGGREFSADEGGLLLHPLFCLQTLCLIAAYQYE